MTAALQHVVATNPDGLQTITLVPIEITPRRKDRAITADLFRFDEVTLRTYLAGTDLDLTPAANELLASRPTRRPRGRSRKFNL